MCVSGLGFNTHMEGTCSAAFNYPGPTLNGLHLSSKLENTSVQWDSRENTSIAMWPTNNYNQKNKKKCFKTPPTTTKKSSVIPGVSPHLKSRTT